MDEVDAGFLGNLGEAERARFGLLGQDGFGNVDHAIAGNPRRGGGIKGVGGRMRAVGRPGFQVGHARDR
jgi:hypothetical protein